jgi:hypothetical protein
VLRQAKGLAQDTLPTIPRYSIAHLARDSEAEPRMSKAVGDAAEPKKTVGYDVAGIEHALELGRLEQAQRFWKLKFSHRR